MPVTVTPLHKHFMAEIGGVDLTRPVAPETFAEIRAAFDRHAILVFHGQPVSDTQQVEFSALFGPVFTTTRYHRPQEVQDRRKEMSPITNIDHEGRILLPDDDRRMHARANQLWHTDNSFKHVPALCSLLSAREIPGTGGNTEFADMRAAYDALPEARKQEIDRLIVEHSIFHSRAKIGFTDYSDGARRELPPVQQVLVRELPESGRKALYIAAHASHVIGWPVEKGRQLIAELMEFATQPEFVYSHRWRAGDLIVWDNRCTMHRATPYAEMTERRVLYRTTVSDEINSVERQSMLSPRKAGAAHHA